MADDVPVIREDRLAAAGKNAAEETDRSVRIRLTIRNVLPGELAAIILRCELHGTKAAEGLGNQAGEHRRAEDYGIFVRGSEVGRVEVVAHATQAGVGLSVSRSPNIRTDPDPIRPVVVVTREERINQVEVVPVGPLHAKRSEQLIDPIAPTEVLADIGVGADQGVAGFHRGDEQEHRGSVDSAVGFGRSTVAQKRKVDAIQHALGQLKVFSGSGRRSAEIRSSDSVGRVGFVDDAEGGVFTATGNSTQSGRQLVFSQTDILIPITLNPDFPSGLGQNGHDVRQLLFPLEGEAQVVQRNVRAVQAGVSQTVRPKTSPKLNSAAQRGNSIGLASAAGVSSCASSIVSNANNAVAGQGLPVGFEVATSVIRQGTLVDEGGNGIAHFIGPSVLLDQFEPRARVDSLAIDVGTDTAGLFHKQLLDGVRSRHCFSYPFKTGLRNCKPIANR